MEHYEELARAAGFVKVEDGTIVPANPKTEGFWEDWQSCCEANGLIAAYNLGYSDA